MIAEALSFTDAVNVVMSEAKAVSAFALVVASLDIAAVLELTVAVRLVISAAKAESPLALAVCSVLIPAVLVFTLAVRLVIAVALAVVSVVRVTISPWAEAIFVVLVDTVELNELYKVTNEASLAFSQPLLVAFLTYIWLSSSVSAHKSWDCNVEPSVLVVGAEVDLINWVELVPPALIADWTSAPILSNVTASSWISVVPVGASPIVKVKVAGDDSEPNVFKELTLAI